MPLYKLGDKQPLLPASGDSYIAPDASVIGDVQLAENASIWFGVVARGDNEPLIIGENSNVQDLSMLHSDMGFPLIIAPNCTIGHKVMLHGCIIGENSLIGMGAMILNGAKIGKNCVIGAYSLIAEGKEIPDNSLVMGQPGRVIRQVSERHTQMTAATVAHYVEAAAKYRKNLQLVTP